MSEAERERGQLFAIDAEIEFDFPDKDKLSETVDYVRVIERIRQINESSSFQLIETLAHAIAETILKDFRQVRRAAVRVKKLRPALAAGITLDAVAAEVIRSRDLSPDPSPHPQPLSPRRERGAMREGG